MSNLDLAVTPSVSDGVSKSPVEPFWFQAASAVSNALTTFDDLIAFVEGEGETMDRFQAYLDDVATDHDNWNDFFATGTEDDLTTWFDANP